MTDIIELLRASNARMGTRDPNDYSVTITVAEANQVVDEIERLRALVRYLTGENTDDVSVLLAGNPIACERVVTLARATLRKNNDERHNERAVRAT